MPKDRVRKDGLVTVYWYEYSESEIVQAWSTDGQGHRQAVDRSDWCVVTECTKDQAIQLSLWFVHHVFAIPTCTHYNGKTLSLYCGDAGRGASTMKSDVEVVTKLFKCEKIKLVKD